MSVEVELKKALYDRLVKGQVVVQFRKVNGDERVMPCTLSPELLPEATASVDPSLTPSLYEADYLRVYATDIQEWRSFRFDNVIAYDARGAV